jgi:hypothetical protein
MSQSLLASENLLQAIVSERKFVCGSASQKAEKSRVNGIVTAWDFVDNLEKNLANLGPLHFLNVKYQSDGVPISEIVTDLL